LTGALDPSSLDFHVASRNLSFLPWMVEQVMSSMAVMAKSWLMRLVVQRQKKCSL